MKSLTIHNLEEPLLNLVREKAKSSKLSINQFVKNLIENAIGYKKTEQPPYYNDFKQFCGI
jgi:phage antirepressor YoqD-like protein